MSSLFSDLFSGLQSEMGGAGQRMPCQMLKCLEDKHNWDKASVVKTNMENYFDKLLIGELDIAIATSIEKYHARVGWHYYNFSFFLSLYSLVNLPLFLSPLSAIQLVLPHPKIVD